MDFLSVRKRNELIGDLTNKQDALEVANEQLTELTGVMAKTEPTADQRTAKQAAWAEENTNLYNESKRAQILDASEIIGDANNEQVQRAANAWEQMR